MQWCVLQRPFPTGPRGRSFFYSLFDIKCFNCFKPGIINPVLYFDGNRVVTLKFVGFLNFDITAGSYMLRRITRVVARLDKDAVFDTNRKSLLRHISAEKGLK